MMNKLFMTLLLFLSLFFISCSTTVGDGCTEDSDCDSGLVCDSSYPGGYCLKYNCNIYNKDSCTDNSQCTYFDETETTYCLAKCNVDDDCRSDYDCKAVSNNEYRVCLPKE